ncbi:MAG: phospholipid carrier-dependent glycosyltransferase [Candidatus Neomarinimicrobiota bacterium]
MKKLLTKNLLNKYSNIIIALSIFCLIFLFTIWSRPSLVPKISPDGYGYWSIAKDFKTSISDASIRPWFFSIIIRVCMLISAEYWQIVLSFFQIVFHSSISVLMFFLFRKYHLKLISAVICALIIGFNPNLIVYTTYILADLIFAVLTTLAWYHILKINDSNHWNYSSIVFASIFCALSLLTKPVALLMIFQFLIAIYLIKGFSYNFLKIAFFMLIINYSLFFSWKIFQWYHNPNPLLTKTSLINGAINWTAIKAGHVDYGKGTSLYQRLEELDKIEKARSLRINLSYTMDESSDFVDVFSSVRSDLVFSSDPIFARQIIKEIPLKIIFLSLAKWHSFFTKRCFFPQKESFPGMIDFVRKIYIKFYSYLYRPLLLIFLISSIIILYKKQYYNLLFTSFGLLFYASLVITLGSPHSGEFIRYRVWVEYVMWFCALVPFGHFLNHMFVYLKYIKKKLFLILSA